MTMSKEVIEKLIMENNRAINGLTRQAMHFVGTDQYFTIEMEIRQLQKEQNPSINSICDILIIVKEKLNKSF